MNLYLDAFAYPLRRHNLGMLVLGLFVLTVLPLAITWSPVGGGTVAWVIDLVLLGYYAVFLESILHSTMQGEDRIPHWPEMNSPMELATDFFSIVAPFLVSFLPLMLLRGWFAGYSALQSSGFVLRSAVPDGSTDWPLWRILIEALFVLLGWLYLPMCVLGWTFFRSPSILNPYAVFKSASQTGPSYLLVAFLVWAMVTAAWAVSLIPGKFITDFGSSLLVFYALVVAVRLIGLHYRIHRKTLGWEVERHLPEPV